MPRSGRARPARLDALHGDGALPDVLLAIVLANIETLVLGARHAEMGRTDYGDYSVEKLLEMGNQTVELVTGVRVAECEALRRSWSGWVEPNS